MTDRDQSSAEGIVTAFIAAFGTADYARMASLLAEDLQSYVTNAQGGVDLLAGRDVYMQAIRSVDYQQVRPRVKITQILTVKAEQVMVMVEVKAERKGRKLHNYAAFLMDIRDGRIAELRMVEALPAFSDAFWKA